MQCLDCDQLKTAKFWKALLVEFLGTLLLVLVGCGSCPGKDIVRISLTFGLSVATIVWAIAHVSGGHINPAITAGFLLTRKFDCIRALLYVVVQSAGAVCGAGILKGVLPAVGLCTPAPGPGVAIWSVFIIELIITFVLVLTVFATCDSLRSGIGGSGPLAIGLAVSMCHLWAVPYTGAAMNPARAFGPAVVSGYLQGDTVSTHAMYWVGPLLGGMLAGVLYDLLFATNATLDKAKSLLSESEYVDSKFGEEGRLPSDVPNSDADLLKEDAASQPDYGTLH